MSHTQAVENYLKAIYKLSNGGLNSVTTNEIAGRMQTKAATVTDMVKKLHTRKLIKHEKYMGVVITEKGMQVALSIIRRHRLWEVFLVDKLGFKWDEVHEMAEELEHVASTELIDRLDRYLNFPKTDPHGDPIPDANGKMKKETLVTLASMSETQSGIVSGVINHSPVFLQHLEKNKINIGLTIHVIEKNDFDNSMTIKTTPKNKLHISRDVASNLLIKASL